MGSASLGWRRHGPAPVRVWLLCHGPIHQVFFFFFPSFQNAGLAAAAGGVAVIHRNKRLLKRKMLSRTQTEPAESVFHVAYITWICCCRCLVSAMTGRLDCAKTFRPTLLGYNEAVFAMEASFEDEFRLLPSGWRLWDEKQLYFCCHDWA